ncbi:Hypothetical protein CINCED_3A024573 [Cinara cedri]|uniref:C3H1-type domain-containing protein n=1 Tax=Cinara cedri TaxID=506608 RepID=A0A5E4N6D0_9HEMI|nr:Hypothetical protein CINCED_3A024573 [Cinara cedri]
MIMVLNLQSVLSNGNNCENEVEEDLEDGEIFDEEDDTEVVESTEQNIVSKLSKENHSGESAKDKDFESLWDMELRHQKMSNGPPHKPFVGFNSRSRGDRFIRNKGIVMKRDGGYLMDDDRSRRKRRRFDQIDEKEPMLRNNQNGIFNNKRKHNETPMVPAEGENDEEMPYINSDISNFDSFPREYENEGEDFRPSRDNNFVWRGRGRRGGGDMDRRSRGMPSKRRIGVGPMKNKRPEDEEKICQYFLQGKCLKENNCTYSHQQPNGRKMELCKFYLMDCCSKEDRCTFMHSEFPCKYYHTGMKCYSGSKCRFSHAKLDEDQKKILLKSFGKLRYDPPEYENEKQDFKNNCEEDQNPIVENNFSSKIDKSKIPSLLEMQIPVPPELKSTDTNPDEDLETNNNSSTPMPSPSQDDPMVDNTFEINENEQLPSIPTNNRSVHKSKKHHDKTHKEKQKQDKEMRKKQKEERQEEKRMEKNRQRKEDMSIQTNDQPLLDELSDDDEFNDLVIDEEKFQNEGKDQPLPKKQKELLKRIQVQQKFYNETDVNDLYIQEEPYSSDVSDNSVSTKNEEKEPTGSLSKPNSSKVEKVDFDQITISDDIAKLLNSIKSQPDKSTKDQQSPFHLPALENHELEEIVLEKTSSIEESPASPTSNDNSAVELGKSDVDLRQLPFQFPVAAATEIDASLDSHPPIKYLLTPTQVSVPDYSKIPPTMGIDDPRLRRSITAARDPMFIQNVPATTTVTPVRPAAPQKSAPRDPRKPQQDVTCASTVHNPNIPIIQTSTTLVQQRPMDSDMRHMPPPIICPQQMMAVRNDPRRKPMVPGDPRQRQRFDVDQRINNINYF